MTVLLLFVRLFDLETKVRFWLGMKLGFGLRSGLFTAGSDRIFWKVDRNFVYAI